MDKKRKFSKKALRDFELIDAAIAYNDQNAFAKYCYGDMPSCKAGDSVACNQATGSYLPEN